MGEAETSIYPARLGCRSRRCRQFLQRQVHGNTTDSQEGADLAIRLPVLDSQALGLLDIEASSRTLRGNWISMFDGGISLFAA